MHGGLHYVCWGPNNPIVMRVVAGVEPHSIPLLPPTGHASIAIHVGLEPPWLSLYVS